jgi:hypothetical protein
MAQPVMLAARSQRHLRYRQAGQLGISQPSCPRFGAAFKESFI